jgi:N-acetylmuramic acid 6-phosphate etherase
VNPRTRDIDIWPTGDILKRINEEDALVAAAVAAELPSIEALVDRIVPSLQVGGRLIYVGAGSSGRLAVLDAAECPPTYGTATWQVQALLAGAPEALTQAVEAVEDDEVKGSDAMDELEIGPNDVVIGVAASGRTPYVRGALLQARLRGAFTAALVGNPGGVAEAAEIVIAPLTGPEVIAGSTRMKAGTAQKMVLNMISTATMIRLGRTFGNLMVDMQARNSKLRRRAEHMVAYASGVDTAEAARALDEANGELKTAIVLLFAGIPADAARVRLAEAQGVVRKALAGAASR